ncbi:M-phase phosphoprotein 6 [Plasmodiophora brassicae]|uniref:M-phase phosphoprotein 6 n=1 Tax=Plasmodiophora brassicae TaxID=37360 RepID=A0A3P3XYZ6_PLABS|nr:unnamed protein product [Plasmodiophora brassicae]
MSGPARSPAGKTALSSRVLGMKFMRRKDEAAHRDNLQRQQSTALEASHWVLVPSAIANVSAQTADDTKSEARVPTRKSFMSFNPAVDSARESYRSAAAAADLERDAARDSLSDKELAARYERYVGGRSVSDEQPPSKKRQKRNNNDNRSTSEMKQSSFRKPKPLI